MKIVLSRWATPAARIDAIPRILVCLFLSGAVAAAAMAADASAGKATNITPMKYVPLLNFADAPAGKYTLDPKHSHLVFQMVHYGGLSRPVLRFRNIQADFTLDPSKPEATKIEARIAPTSIESGDKDFDVRMNAPDVLRGYDPSDDGIYRWITFESTSIEFRDAKKNAGVINGDLTIKGVTRPIKINFTYNGFFKNVLGAQKMGFSGNGGFKRSDFGIKSVPTAADDLTFMIEFEFQLLDLAHPIHE